MGLGARGVAAAGTTLSCSPAATTDDLPPRWVLFGGAGVSRLLGVVDLPRSAALGVFPGVLPRGTLGTPTLSRVPEASREGVGARPVVLRPGELGRGGDTDRGSCLPRGTADGSRVLQAERAERGWEAAAPPSLQPSAGHLGEGGKKIQGHEKNKRFGARGVFAPLTCLKGPSGAPLAPGAGWHPPETGWQGPGGWRGHGTPR